MSIDILFVDNQRPISKLTMNKLYPLVESSGDRAPARAKKPPPIGVYTNQQWADKWACFNGCLSNIFSIRTSQTNNIQTKGER